MSKRCQNKMSKRGGPPDFNHLQLLKLVQKGRTAVIIVSQWRLKDDITNNLSSKGDIKALVFFIKIIKTIGPSFQ